MQKVSVDESKCIHCGMCIANCSDVFAYGNDGESVVIKELVEDDNTLVIKACEECPTDAISLTPVDGTQSCGCEDCNCDNCNCQENN